MTNMTFFEAQKRASLFMQQHNLDDSMAKFFLLELFKWDMTHLLLHYRDDMDNQSQNRYFTAVDKYIQGYPAQYIVGNTIFYGNRFDVDERVLIPRPETEELVEWVLNDYQDAKNLKVLDLGTGSGAIAISLNKTHPEWSVVASDISSDALDVAHHNNVKNNTNVKFILSDLFTNITDDFDVIISNPPYIASTEKNLMDMSVIEYEPHQALFAENNGLLMYQKIANYIKMKSSDAHGTLYLEIGFKQNDAVTDIFTRSLPEAKIFSKHDFFGNPRMIKVIY